MNRCGDCCYWSSMNNSSGLCRIRAPQAVPSVRVQAHPVCEGVEAAVPVAVYKVLRGTLAIWPHTGSEDWCGEFHQGTRLGGI